MFFPCDLCFRLQASANGIQWMGLTDDRLLYTATTRNITVWNINIVTQFWAMTRSKVRSIQLERGEGKSTRVTAQSEDGRFVLLFMREMVPLMQNSAVYFWKYTKSWMFLSKIVHTKGI